MFAEDMLSRKVERRMKKDFRHDDRYSVVRANVQKPSILDPKKRKGKVKVQPPSKPQSRRGSFRGDSLPANITSIT